MIPIYQASDNDCFRACVASIREVSLDEVPWPKRMSPHKWLTAWNLVKKWLRPDTLIWWKMTPGGKYPDGYWIASVETLADDWLHAVVYENEQFVHDPGHFVSDHGVEALHVVNCIQIRSGN